VRDLETPRLRLHALTAEEARTLRAGEQLPGWRFDRDYPLPDTKDGLGFYLEHGDREFGFFLAVRRADEVVIGEIGFVGPPREGAVTIGYAVVPSARGQGYATEAIGAIAGWALAQNGVEEVRAQTLPGNEPSVRALLRAGFGELESTPTVRRFALRREG
jgi:RimJ/RimL family protein N-acetyltransferase